MTHGSKSATSRTYGVTNAGRFDASDVELRLIFPNGRESVKRADVLKGCDYDGAPVSPAQDLAILITDMQNDPVFGLAWKTLVVRFSDASGHARWERRYDYEVDSTPSFVETRLV